MSQHDFTIANQTAVNARADINNALQALASLNSGSGAPSTTYANMLWYETDTNRLYIRNEANNAWLNFGYIDQSGGFRPLDNTPVVTTSGSQTGILGDQTTGTWQAGTGTTDSLVSPADVRAAIDARVTTSRVTALNASASVGGVGTYAFLNINSTSPSLSTGSTIAGSSLRYSAGVTANYSGSGGPTMNAGSSPSGTWRCMGNISVAGSNGLNNATLYLRIS